MHEEDTPVFWELMFLKFHGLRDKETAGLFGELLAARYGPPEKHLPSGMDQLLAQLERAESSQRAAEHQQPSDPFFENRSQDPTMRPLLLAFEIVDAIEGAAEAGASLNVEAAADAIAARHPEAGVTPHEIAEVLREESLAAGVLPAMPANVQGACLDAQQLLDAADQPPPVQRHIGPA